MADSYSNQPAPITHYIKIYPTCFKLIEFKQPYVPDSPYQAELKRQKRAKRGARLLTEDEKFDNQHKALMHAKTVMADIAMCNEFELFATMTLSCRACIPKCINKPCSCSKAKCLRYNLDYAVRTQKTWYNNQIKRFGRFRRLHVMELHRDKGYHFHALFGGYSGPLKYWRKDPKDGRSVYRLASNRKGWTTVKKIYDPDGTASYVRKYIDKDMPLLPGKKRFWSSQGLNRPIVTQNEELRQQILHDPQGKLYVPEHKPLTRPSGTVNDEESNIAAIVTLPFDNRLRYATELSMLRTIKLMTGTTKPRFDVFDPFETPTDPYEPVDPGITHEQDQKA